MSDNKYEYKDIGLIKSDLKRLKKWISLADDIENVVKIIIGEIKDSMVGFPPRAVFGDLITQNTLDGNEVFFYKKRIPIKNPKTCPSSGGRLVYGFIKNNGNFVPILVYGAFEEGNHYPVGGKKIPLQSYGLAKIVSEKLNLL